MSVNSASLITHLQYFTHRLRVNGIAIDASRLIDYHRAVELTGITNRADFKQAAFTTLISRKDDYDLFDQIFDQYWGGTPSTILATDQEPTNAGGDHGTGAGSFEPAIAESSSHDAASNHHGACSQLEVIRRKDLAKLSEAELRLAEDEIAQTAKLFAHDYSRRRAAANKGREIHFKKLLRLKLTAPDSLKIPRRRRFKNRARLLVFCDVSGSMDSYSRFFLHLLFGVKRAFNRTSIALFSTRATDVTPHFKVGSLERCLGELSQHVTEWSGGTKIGSSLQIGMDFFAEQLRPNTGISVIISDGWDTGDSEVLRTTMLRLRQRSRYVVWLNPLLGDDRYQPLCKGMKTALPHIDYFLPAHDIISLGAALQQLAVLAQNKPIEQLKLQERQYRS